jgi:hypothetical protein
MLVIGTLYKDMRLTPPPSPRVSAPENPRAPLHPPCISLLFCPVQSPKSCQWVKTRTWL